MNLDNVTVEMRPRRAWEAADFGARMIRRDAAAIYRVWFSVTLPLVSLALLLVAYSPYPAFAALIYWWLEPIADGPILRIISRRLFGEDADVRTALRMVPALAWRNRIFLISPYRFHPARSTAMPVTQLESLAGAPRRKRAKVLNQKILNYGTGVTIAYQHLALALYFGVVLIGYALVPTAFQGTLGLEWMGLFWEDGGRSATALSLILLYVAQSALQPWFIGAGFGLYINCRTQLEAWDIEVAFRRMVQRRVNGLSVGILLAVLAVSVAHTPQAALAQETEISHETESPAIDPGFAGYWVDDDVKPKVQTVLTSDALKTTREIETWQAIDSDEPEPDDDGELTRWWIDLIQGVGRIMSFIVEFGLWIVLALLLCLVFLNRWRWLPYLGRQRATTPITSRIVLASGEVSADLLEDDVPAAVLRLWNSGDKRRALGLLYRSSILAAVIRHGVQLPPCATEGACAMAVGQQADTAQSDYFRRVVSAWIRCAYGNFVVDNDAVVTLCSEWPRHFGGVK